MLGQVSKKFNNAVVWSSLKPRTEMHQADVRFAQMSQAQEEWFREDSGPQHGGIIYKSKLKNRIWRKKYEIIINREKFNQVPED